MSRRVSWRSSLSSGTRSGWRELGGDLDRVLDQVRRDGDRRRGLGDRELDPVAVGDRAAAGGHDDLRGLLGGGGLAQRVGLDDAEPAGAQAGEGEHAQEDREEEADPPLDQPHALSRPALRSVSSVPPVAGYRSGRRYRPGRESPWPVGIGVAVGCRGRGRLRRRRGGRGRDPSSPRTTGGDRRHQRPGHDAVVGHQLLRGVARRAHAAGGRSERHGRRARAGSARRRPPA